MQRRKFCHFWKTCMINCFGVIGVARTMSEDGGARFRESKTVYEERKLHEKLFPRQLNIKTNERNNFWRMANFSVCYSSRFKSRRNI